MTDHDAILAAILENPDDDFPRLQYADLLEEQGEGKRAEFIRVQIKIALLPQCHRMPKCDGPRMTWCERCLDKRGLLQREQELLKFHGKPICFESQCSIHEMDVKFYQFPGSGEDFLHSHGFDLSQPYKSYRNERDRIIEFWQTRIVPTVYRRGFVEGITCTWHDWHTHSDTLTTRHPIREVRLTTWSEVEGQFNPPSNSNYLRLKDSAFVAEISYLAGNCEILNRCINAIRARGNQ